MNDYTVFVSGLDARTLDFDHQSHSSSSPMSNIESFALDDNCLVSDVARDRCVLGELNVSDNHSRSPLKLHRSHSRQTSFAATRPSMRRPPPLCTKSLPSAPVPSSPTAATLSHAPTPPSISQPELSWGVSATSPSFPSSPVSTAEQGRSRPASPPTGVSDAEFLHTGSILRAFDELDASPALSDQSPTYARNHPYIPWSHATRVRVIERDTPSPRSTVSFRRSRPPSRSGARAPEPTDSVLGSPHQCWAPRPNGRWARFTRAVRRNVEHVQRHFLRRPRVTATTPAPMPLHVYSPTPSPSDPQLAVDIPSGIISPVHLLPPLASPSSQAETAAATVLTRSPSSVMTPVYHLYSRPQSPSAASFTSAGTTALDEWLADRRRLSLERRLSGIEEISLDEYERRGSWLLRAHVVPPENENANEDEQAAQNEANRRAEAVRQGWVCGFVGCAMHPLPGQSPGKCTSPIHWTSTCGPPPRPRLAIEFTHSTPTLLH